MKTPPTPRPSTRRRRRHGTAGSRTATGARHSSRRPRRGPLQWTLTVGAGAIVAAALSMLAGCGRDEGQPPAADLRDPLPMPASDPAPPDPVQATPVRPDSPVHGETGANTRAPGGDAGTTAAQDRPLAGPASGAAAGAVTPPAADRQAGRDAVEQGLTPTLARIDEEFVAAAVAAHRYGAELGALGARRAQSQAVRSLAGQLVRAHELGRQSLREVAQARGAAVPDALAAEHRRTLDELGGQGDAGFDLALVQSAVIPHEQQLVELYRRAAATTRDPAVQALVQERLPALEGNLAQAQQTPIGPSGAPGPADDGAAPGGGPDGGTGR